MKQSLEAAGLAAFVVLGGIVLPIQPAAAVSYQNVTISVTYDLTVNSTNLPGGLLATFENAFNTVASSFQSALITPTTNPYTVYVTVSAGSVHGSSLNGSVSGSWTNAIEMQPSGTTSTAAQTYANTVAALQPNATALGYTMPGSDPTGGNHFYYMPTAEVKALALSQATYPVSGQDGYIGFSNALNEFYYGTTPVSGEYSFQAAAMHEMEEVLGRVSSLNNGGLTAGFTANPLDLFRYGSDGNTSFGENATAYASVDGGKTSLGTFDSTSSGGDRSDWSTPINTNSTDAQNASLTPGENEGLSMSDQGVLKALGYTPSSSNGLFKGSNAPVGATPSVNQVPEPTSLSLLAVGAGVAGLLRRRPRRFGFA